MMKSKKHKRSSIINKKGGQYQIVIGTYVHDVYLDICKIANIEEKEEKKIMKIKKRRIS